MLITGSNLTFILKNVAIYPENCFNLQHILVLIKYTEMSNIKNLKLIYLLKNQHLQKWGPTHNNKNGLGGPKNGWLVQITAPESYSEMVSAVFGSVQRLM